MLKVTDIHRLKRVCALINSFISPVYNVYACPQQQELAPLISLHLSHAMYPSHCLQPGRHATYEVGFLGPLDEK